MVAFFNERFRTNAPITSPRTRRDWKRDFWTWEAVPADPAVPDEESPGPADQQQPEQAVDFAAQSNARSEFIARIRIEAKSDSAD